MSNVEIVPLTPTFKDAEPLAQATRADMERSYARAREASVRTGQTFTAEQEQAIQDALAATNADRSISRIKHNPNQYFSAVIDGDQVAFLRANTWGLADQAPYEKQPVRGLFDAASHAGWLHRLNASFGVFALFGNPEAPHHHEDGMDALLKHAVSLAGDRKVKLGLSEGDPLIEIVDENLFEPTGKIATDVKNVPNLAQELYVRSPNA